MSEKEIIKANILNQLKVQWKDAVNKQYKENPDKVKNADVTKNAKDICSNFMVKMAMRQGGITNDDILRVLSEIKDEVIKENNTQQES